jgi:hypothetical protein
MPAVDFSPGGVSRRCPAVFSGCDADHGVVWIRGAQDASTVVALCMTMARAIAFDDSDLVIDLSGVTFMDATRVEVMVRQNRGHAPEPGGSAPTGKAVQGARESLPQPRPAMDLGGRVTVPKGGGSVDAPDPPVRPPTRLFGRGGLELPATQTGTVTAGPRPPTAHDSAVLATIAAAYDLGAKSGSVSLRGHDLLRRLHRSASVLRDATAAVEKEVRTHPDAATARDALALLVEVRRIGLFYEGSL